MHTCARAVCSTRALADCKMNAEHLLQAKVRKKLRRRLNSRGHFQLATLVSTRLHDVARRCVNLHIDTTTIWSAGSGKLLHLKA